MNQRIIELKSEIRELIEAHTCMVTPVMEMKRDFHFERICKDSLHFGKSYSILDLNENRFTFHVSAHEKWLPEPVINTDEHDNFEQAYKLTHPEDLQNVLENELRGMHFLQKLTPEHKNNFKLLYMRRLMNKKGGFKLYLHRVSMLESDTNGKPWLLQICTEQVACCFSNLSLVSKFYLLFPLNQPNRKKREIFVNNTWLTEQELKILQFVYDGHEQSDITEVNFVSLNTVKTHFYTIRKKLNIKNIQLAAHFAKQTGILSQLLIFWINCGRNIEDLLGMI